MLLQSLTCSVYTKTNDVWRKCRLFAMMLTHLPLGKSTSPSLSFCNIRVVFLSDLLSAVVVSVVSIIVVCFCFVFYRSVTVDTPMPDVVSMLHLLGRLLGRLQCISHQSYFFNYRYNKHIILNNIYDFTFFMPKDKE